MTASVFVAFALAVGLFLLAVRAARAEAASQSLALGTLAIGALAPFPYAIGLVPVAAAAFYTHRRAFLRAERDREAVLAHISDRSPVVPITEIVDPQALAALETFRQRERARAAGAVTEQEERHAEGRSTNVRSRFMAAMGHELRSPLNSIIGFAQVLEDGGDGPLTPAQRENVTLVRVAAEELLLLLTDILDSSRLEAGRVKLDRKWTASVEILTMTATRARPMLESVERELDAEMQPGLPPLFVDRVRIAQSLHNLVRQALKGGGKRPLRLRARSITVDGKAMVRFDVVDPTRELTDAEVKHAFDPDPDLPRSAGRSLAMGLALGLARDLTRLHGGEAGCENAGGACWYLTLPVALDTARA